MEVKRETELHDPGQERDEENERKEGAMKLPPDVEFHEDIRLFIYRPHGAMNEEADQQSRIRYWKISKQVAGAFQPIHRIRRAADEIELNFEVCYSSFSSSASFLCGSSTGEISDSSDGFDR